AQGWNGTSPLKSTAMSRTYRFSRGSQMPERSGFPSRVRGAGADRFIFPSGVCGMPAVGSLVHCAHAGADNSKKVDRNTARESIGRAYMGPPISGDYTPRLRPWRATGRSNQCVVEFPLSLPLRRLNGETPSP